jgi:hypothetical protein
MQDSIYPFLFSSKKIPKKKKKLWMDYGIPRGAV